jgi:plasmid stabilization system protein ParE
MAEARRFHPLVAEDLGQPVRYYDDVSVELGNRFRDSARDRFRSISEFPESYGRIHGQTRAAMTSRFPYVILFELRGDTVLILDVFHAASDQTGWFDRSL